MDPIYVTIPGAAVGKGRPRHRIVKPRKGPEFVQVYTPRETAQYEGIVRHHAKVAMQQRRLVEGPVDVAIIIRVRPPDSWPQWKRDAALRDLIRPDSKPDSDNIKKAILDAMNQVVWVDDNQVTDAVVRKRYHTAPAVLVRVTPLPRASSRITRRDQLPAAPPTEEVAT